MTYGVYSRDLNSLFISGLPGIDECKKYCHNNCVVCSEKKIWCGWSIRFIFHKWRGVKVSPRWGEWRFGFMDIDYHTHRYTWADKIVYDPKKESEMSNGEATK